ncbi:NrdH-redoxin [Rhodocyclus purpureus]|uniref:NrdH-redoxin n=1 Tax=Rhodocyclus purpureus TaxID=1067 RepID=UPI001913B9E9|nr:NrdH-redoxin [Rhodocyclus purpureus]MBK5914026.1 hypothetical protein [Rhodocyclus purpureus]
MSLRVILAIILLLGAFGVRADDPWSRPGADGRAEVQLYFFWSTTCPHCTAAHPFVSAIPQQRPWVRVHALEVSRQPDNFARFEDLARLAGGEAEAVPSFVFCGEMHTGWDGEEGSGAELLRRLDACHARNGVPASAVGSAARAEGRDFVELPYFGRVAADSLSLPLLTIVLAGLDAFNPCAFFVLLFLLSMLVHQQSRRRMLLIGGIFVAVSALMYFAFMAAWLKLFMIVGQLAWVTLAAGALAVVVGLLNVKDFFFLRQGPSLSIPEAKKPDLFRRARAVLAADKLPALLAATGLLAIAANFYELLCTAGFPMVYTHVLSLANLDTATRYAWLAAYNLIYVLPLAAIVVVFARTLGARKLGEREGRLLKLLSGLMMCGLGALLLLAPERMGQPGVAFLLLASALAATWVAARMTRAR